MKTKFKIIVFFTISIMLCNLYLYSQEKDKNKILYKEEIHQYIVKEAYKVLIYQYPKYEYSELATRIGDMENYGPWTAGKVVAGAYREDWEDPVYGKGGPFNGWDPSSTHFWNADQGDDSKISVPLSGLIENAYQKARVYIYGSDIWSNRRIFFQGVGQPIGEYYSYNSLFDFYNTNHYYSEGYVDAGGSIHFWDRYLCTMNSSLTKNLTYELLGRTCHLLADMTVPAHVNPALHPLGDKYEYLLWNNNYYLLYNATSALNAGELLNVNTKYDPLRYLFYTTNEIADHYPCLERNILNGWSPGGSGNNDYIASYGSDTYSELANMISSLGNPPSPNDIDAVNQASVCEVMAIRSNAGLLHWFCVQTNQASQVFFVPEDYSTVNQAMNAATAGNVVLVHYGTYSISSNMTVPSGVILHIHNGAVLNIGNNVNLTVAGTLVTRQGSILNFTGASSKITVLGSMNSNGSTFQGNGTMGSWYGIEASSTASVNLVNYSIKDATTGAYFNGTTSFTFQGNTLTNNTTGADFNNIGYLSSLISSNVAYSNGTGLRFDGSSYPLVFLHNNIHDNTSNVYIASSSAPDFGMMSDQGQNSIFYGEPYDIKSYYSGTIYSRYCWFGGGYPAYIGSLDFNPILDNNPNPLMKSIDNSKTSNPMFKRGNISQNNQVSDIPGIKELDEARILLNQKNYAEALSAFDMLAD